MARAAVTNRVSTGNILLANANFENYPTFTAQTNVASRFITGTAAGSTTNRTYVWACPSGAVTSSSAAGFDSTVSHSGSASMKLSTLNATGAITVAYNATVTTTITAADLKYVFVMLPNTFYTLTGFVKTNNVATNSAFINIRQVNSSGTQVATTASSKLSGTNDWTQLTVTVTTQATAAFGTILLSNSVAGNTSDAWFDDLVLICRTSQRVAVSNRQAVSNRKTP